MKESDLLKIVTGCPIDLQMHSSYSDGDDDLTVLIQKAAAASIDVISVTDHDTTMQNDELNRIASQQTNLGNVNELLTSSKSSKSVFFIPGTELSCLNPYDKDELIYPHGSSLHILGYGIESQIDTNIELMRVQSAQQQRLAQVVVRFKHNGIPLDFDALNHNRKGPFITRWHVVRAAYQAIQKIDRESLAGYETFQLFDKSSSEQLRYLREQTAVGGFAYIPYASDFFEIRAAVNLIKSYGGIPVWSHPGRSLVSITKGILRRKALEFSRRHGLETRVVDPEMLHPEKYLRSVTSFDNRLNREIQDLYREVSKEGQRKFFKLFEFMLDSGIRGLETYNHSHSRDQIDLLSRLAEKYGLIPTTGSDYHGDFIRPDIPLGIAPSRDEQP